MPHGFHRTLQCPNPLTPSDGIHYPFTQQPITHCCHHDPYIVMTIWQSFQAYPGTSSYWSNLTPHLPYPSVPPRHVTPYKDLSKSPLFYSLPHTDQSTVTCDYCFNPHHHVCNSLPSCSSNKIQKVELDLAYHPYHSHHIPIRQLTTSEKNLLCPP